MHRGHESRHLFPESWGCSGRALWEVHCGVWRRAWQSSWASSLVLQRSRRRPGGSSGRHGRCCGRYCPPGVAWRRSEGPTGRGLDLVKVRTRPRVAPTPFEGSCGGKARGKYGELAAQWLEQCRARLAQHRKFPQWHRSVRNGRAVPGVGGRDSDNSHCGEWRPDVI